MKQGGTYSMCERVGGWGAAGGGVAIAGGLMMQFSGSGVTKQHKGRDYSN